MICCSSVSSGIPVFVTYLPHLTVSLLVAGNYYQENISRVGFIHSVGGHLQVDYLHSDTGQDYINLFSLNSDI